MEKIKIRCTTGITLPLDNIHYYHNNLKKHSMLEIERLVDSIQNDGFLFPVAIGKLNDKNYIIDGEATVEALFELQNRGFEIPEIPVFLVRCKTEQDLKKMILIGTSTNHCVTEISLKKFVEGMDVNLKNYGFSSSDLIDFHNVEDLNLYDSVIGGKPTSIEHNEKDFEGLLK